MPNEQTGFSADLVRQDGRSLLEQMIRVREFEDGVHRSYLKGLLGGSTHLCHGQEAISAGVMHCLGPKDYITYTYRGHGHCIARGMSMERAFAELFGRRTGVCGGLGGSMHLTDPDLGLVGSFAIVGAGLPFAVGAGMSAMLRGEEAVSVTFFGDGSTNIGAFHESLNLAAIWKLPVIFVCENNLYGEYTRISDSTPIDDLSIRATSYGMPGKSIDGNDVFTVVAATKEAKARALSGAGPTLLECKTYRQRGHSRSDPAKYRPQEEVDHWMKRDPIQRAMDIMISAEIMTEDQISALRKQIKDEVAASADAAANAPWPAAADLGDLAYAGRS